MNETSRPTPQVLVLGAVADSQVERLRRSCAVDQVAHADVLRPEGRRLLKRADGLLVTGQFPVDVRLLEAAPRLKVVSLRAVGHDSVDLLECARRGIQVCNTPGVLDAAVAELTVLLILAVARRLPEHVISTCDHIRPQVTLGRDLAGRTLGIVGLGRIGKRVARIAALGLGMDVLHTTRRVPAEEGSGWVRTDELLARSDVVSLHLPLTDATRHIVGARELKLMKQGAILVNASRAGLVDHDALADCLNQDHLYGAGLDVTAQEWIPVDHPLRQAPNVVLTPHLGSATEETRTAMAQMAVSNLLLALRGDPPLSVVNA